MDVSSKQLKRALGLSECITITAGAVIGVGLFTVGSATVGTVGSSVIIATIIAFLLVLYPSAIYGELGAALPLAGGTYAFAKRGINYPTAVFCSWHYTIAQIGIGGAEALAFANYFGWLLKGLGIDVVIDPRILASVLMIFFVIINYLGIEFAGKWQNGFMFFFWGASLIWFGITLKELQFDHFLPVFSQLPSEITAFAKVVVMVWWCFAGFETVVGMGAEVKFPRITIPRALMISPFIVFGINALFQFFLVGITPLASQAVLTVAEAPFAEAMQLAGIVGFPFVLLCLGITFGGDFSTMNPCVTGPARYMYVMAEDGCFPKIFSRIHPKYKSPHVALITVGIFAVVLIATGSIAIIAAMCAFSQMICYIIGYLSYLLLYKKEPNLERPWKVPYGKFGAVLSIIIYAALMILAVDWGALPWNIGLSVMCLVYYFIWVRKRPIPQEAIDLELLTLQTIPPTAEEKVKLDRQYNIWRFSAYGIALLAVLIFIIGYAIRG
jgi:APA family basic amino acid/polyamine antiporter